MLTLDLDRELWLVLLLRPNVLLDIVSYRLAFLHSYIRHTFLRMFHDSKLLYIEDTLLRLAMIKSAVLVFKTRLQISVLLLKGYFVNFIHLSAFTRVRRRHALVGGLELGGRFQLREHRRVVQVRALIVLRGFKPADRNLNLVALSGCESLVINVC